MTDTYKLSLAIEKSGLSNLDISRKTKIPYGHFVKLVEGVEPFMSKEINRVCEVVGIPMADRAAIFFGRK